MSFIFSLFQQIAYRSKDVNFDLRENIAFDRTSNGTTAAAIASPKIHFFRLRENFKS